MAFAGSESVAGPARSFGRAGPGQPGARRAPLLRAELLPPSPSLRDRSVRWDALCRRVEAAVRPNSMAVDLRAHPGSRRWFAGLARLVLYALPALLCWPGFVPFEAAPLPLPGDAERAELRAQAIRPLLAGGATGRHFAASDMVARLDSVPERATIALEAVLGENDDLAHMLQRLGLAARDADAVNALVAPLGNPAPGTRFAVTLGSRAATGEPRPLQSLAFRAAFDLDVAIARQSGGLVLVKRPIPIDTTPAHLVGTTGASLYRSARAAGADPETVQAYLQAIDQYLPFEAIAPTDRFELVVAHKRALDTTPTGPNGPKTDGLDGELLYAGVLRDGKPLLQVMRWGSDGNFYTPEAFAGNITSWFGMRRHPLLGYVRLHAGVDFSAAYGTPIYAVTDGTVVYAGWHGGHGNYVRLAHGGGIDTGYGHMSRIAVGPGARVSRGQVIGYVGATGLATGPHLHYELYRNGQPVDPLSIRFVPHHTDVSPQQLTAFRTRMHQLLALPALASSN